MCKRFEEWKDEIKEYCDSNSLSFDKATKMVQSSSKDMLLLQYFDSEAESVKKGLGLLDETPMPAVLWVIKKGNALEFEQTEYTRKYLSL
ncbi:MAG: hypothetical protein J6C82_04960 [Clostridia bacterium]|nr:hypothetical protein [Clostridia bacterium]